MKYEITEELVKRGLVEGEVPFRCARIETWVKGAAHPRQVGYLRVPSDVFSKVAKVIQDEQ